MVSIVFFLTNISNPGKALSAVHGPESWKTMGNLNAIKMMIWGIEGLKFFRRITKLYDNYLKLQVY